MPAKKHTEANRTPPTSPTSTSASADRHRLRHAGPNITTRSSVSAASSKPPLLPTPAHPETTPESQHTHKSFTEVPSPGAARTSFAKFLYVVLFVVLLLFGWCLYGMVTLLEQLKEEVGWWGIVVGNPGGTTPWGTFEGVGFGSGRSARRGGQSKTEKSAKWRVR